MPRVQPPPTVACPNCGAPVQLTGDWMCFRCEMPLPDEPEFTDRKAWHRGEDD